MSYILESAARKIDRTLEDVREEAQEDGYLIHESDPEHWIQTFREDLFYSLEDYTPNGDVEEIEGFRAIATSMKAALEEVVLPSQGYLFECEVSLREAGNLMVLIAKKCPEIGKEIAAYMESYAEHENPKARAGVKSIIGKINKVLDKASALENVVSGGPLDGKTVVFTGTLSIGRDEAAVLAAQYGAKTAGSISSRTDYLVVGERTVGSKLDKAHSLGVAVLNEAEFRALCVGPQQDTSAVSGEKWQAFVADKPAPRGTER